MKRLTALVAASLVLAIGLPAAQGAVWYFDQNDDAAGSGVASQQYNWTTDGSGAGPGFWNFNNADGTQASPGLNTASWVNGNDAVFSAGTDADGVTYALAIGAGVTANSVLFEEGTVVINSGTIDTGANTVTIGTGAGSNAVLQVSAAAFNNTGKLVIDGAKLRDTNSTGTGGTLVVTGKNIEVTANGGTVEYASTFINVSPNFSTPARNFNMTTASVLGTGGTTTNGGVGTLTIDAKTVPGTVGLNPDPNGGYSEVRMQAAGTANNTYAKLKVIHGMFRFGNVTGANFETAAGAVPTAPLADAITLDGGYLGASWSPTLHVNRGITIGPNGGGFDNGGGIYQPSAGGGNITVPGPFSGSGEFIVRGISSASGNRQGSITLSNANNVNTFTGGLNVIGSTLVLNESLNAAYLKGDHLLTTPSGVVGQTTPCGLITIATNKTLTIGSDNSDTSYDGQTSGAGSVTKVGTGTLTLNSFAVGAGNPEWQNTGGVNISDGVIKYTTSGAGLTGPITIGATGKLNMNGINDTFASLTGPVGGIVDMKDVAANPGNLTLNGASPIDATYSGTIVGGGNFTKSSSSKQTFAGNTTLGTVALNGGTTINNATMTAGGGVTVATGATLGGTGTVVGATTLNGILSPGTSVGTINITGNLSDSAATAAHWAIELSGATADLVAVAGNIDLTGVDFLDVTGTGTGSSWLIGTYTGSLTGVFDTITSGYTVNYTGGNITLNAAPAGLPGDFNSDGKVDAGDYATWRKNDGTNNALANDSGLGVPVGPAHYNLWRQNFGNPPGAGSGGGLNGGAVPEPTTIGLVLVGLAAFGFGRRSRVA